MNKEIPITDNTNWPPHDYMRPAGPGWQIFVYDLPSGYKAHRIVDQLAVEQNKDSSNKYQFEIVSEERSWSVPREIFEFILKVSGKI